MDHLKALSREAALALTKKRKGEVRIGERAHYADQRKSFTANLKASKTKFVLLGLPEDIGIRANFGRGGAHTAWKPALENILSIQSNAYFSGDELFVAGEVNFDDLMDRSALLSTKNQDELILLRELTAEVDKRVTAVIAEIVSAGKIPLLVGGGHNNSYGILKGTALALRKLKNKKNGGINCINCDAHTDMRAMEGRHSGNGFSYAFHEGYLDKYSVVGVHENYLTQHAADLFRINNKKLSFSTYEDIFVREKISFANTLKKHSLQLKTNFCGVELDLDAITNVPSSAKTSSGISPVQARNFVYFCAKNLNAAYFHVAEGAPILAHIKADNKTGKLIGYLVTDFIKGVLEKKKKR